MKTVFERIIEGELPCDKVLETDSLIAIRDIAPKAKVHILIIPKKRISSLQELQEKESSLLWKVIEAAQAISRQEGIEKSGYRLVTNVGPHAGQTIYHLHFHLLGGEELDDMG